MEIQEIQLQQYYPALCADGCNPTLLAYLTDNSTQIERDREHPAVIICPGGAYIDLSDRESEAVALYFLTLGFQAFVLRYSVYPHIYPSQLLEVCAAIMVCMQQTILTFAQW